MTTYRSNKAKRTAAKLCASVKDGQILACAQPKITLDILLSTDVADTGVQENCAPTHDELLAVGAKLNGKLGVVNEALKNFESCLQEHDIVIVGREINLPDMLLVGPHAHGKFPWEHEG